MRADALLDLSTPREIDPKYPKYGPDFGPVGEVGHAFHEKVMAAIFKDPRAAFHFIAAGLEKQVEQSGIDLIGLNGELYEVTK